MTQPSNTIVYYTSDLGKSLELAYENSTYAEYTGSTKVYADEGLTLPLGVVCLNLGVYKKGKKQILSSSVSFDDITTITGDVAHCLTLKDGETVWRGGTNSSCETGDFTDAVGVATGKKLNSSAYKFEVVYGGYYTFARK